MSTFPPTFVQQIDGAIQQGRKAVAQVLGQSYNVYRLSASTSNAMISGTPLLTNFPVRLQRAQKSKIENQSFDILTFKGTCDGSQLQLGDILVENGYQSEPGNIFYFAQRRPTRELIFVRLEWNVNITRPFPLAGNAAQQPTSGAVYNSAYGGIPKGTEQLCTLTNGLFLFQSSGTQASIPAGLQPLKRVRDGHSLGTPTDLYRDDFLMFVPLLPGVQINELDRLNFPNSDRYQAAHIYTSDGTGLNGYVVIAEKLGV